jgi:hypothetical protein
MKKALILAVVVVAAGILFLAVKLINVTDPYVVKPVAVLPAPIDAKMGYTVDAATRTLSVVSRKEVVVVSDPGAFFSHEVLWILQVPKKEESRDPVLYRVELPKFADTAHIKLQGSDTPPKIAKFANGDQWR